MLYVPEGFHDGHAGFDAADFVDADPEVEGGHTPGDGPGEHFLPGNLCRGGPGLYWYASSQLVECGV